MKITRAVSLTLSLFAVLAILLSANPGFAQEPWHAWVYSDASHQLTLLDPAGEILTIPSPAPRDETIYPTRKFAISRDGARLAMVSDTSDQRPLVLFHDFATGAEAVWTGAPLEWSLPTLDGQFTIPTVNFSPDGRLFALGVGYPDGGTWRVLVFDALAGTVVFELSYADPGVVAFLQGQPQAVGYIMPVVRLFDSTAIHIQLVPADVQGIAKYPALAWSPGDGRIAPSNLDHAFMDIAAASQEALYPYENSAVGSSSSFGFTAPFNAIGRGSNATENLWAQNGALVVKARWAAGASAAVFQTQNPNDFTTAWNFLSLAAPGAAIALAENYQSISGTPDGFLSLSESGAVAFHTVAQPGQPLSIMAIPAGPGEIIWVQTAGVPYAGPRR
jgi:hypothetical protein